MTIKIFDLLIIVKIYSVRGTLGSLVVLTTNLGLLLSFIMGEFCDYYFIPKFAIVLLVVYAVSFTFFHESPIFLMRQNNITVNMPYKSIYLLPKTRNVLNFCKSFLGSQEINSFLSKHTRIR